MGQDCLVSSTPSLFPLLPLCVLPCCDVEDLLCGSSLHIISNTIPSVYQIPHIFSLASRPFPLSSSPTNHNQKHKAYPASHKSKRPNLP